MSDTSQRKRKKKARINPAYGGEAPGTSAAQTPSLPSRKSPKTLKSGKASTPVLFKKTSTCYGSLQNLNIDYLDEQSEAKAIGEGKIVQGIGYLTKEEVGQVHAGGFLHSQLVEMQKEGEGGPFTLDNETRKKRILEAWGNHIKRHTKTDDPKKKIKMGHKLVFSLDSKFQKKLEDKGINTDMVVQSIMRDSLRKFSETYHPGDRVGYAYGIHHDTDNLHVHVFVNAKTEKGKDVGISSALKRSKTNTWQKDKIGQIKNTVSRNAKKWDNVATNSEAYRSFSAVKRNQKFFYAPKIPVNDPHLEISRRKLIKIESQIKHRHENPDANYMQLASRFRRARIFYNRLKEQLKLNNGSKNTTATNESLQEKQRIESRKRQRPHR